MRHPSHRRVLRATLALATVLLAAFPAIALAHAEFESSTPADGATVDGSPSFVRAEFTEALGDGSEMALLDASGATIAEGGIDPANPARMRIDPPELAPGTYEVQWKAFADDGHLETGTFSFTVAAAVTPAPSTDAPTPSAPASADPSASAPSDPPAASPSPSEGPVPPPASSSDDVLIPIIVGVVVLGGLGAYLGTRRRPARP